MDLRRAKGECGVGLDGELARVGPGHREDEVLGVNDKMSFPSNSIVIGRTVVMPAGSPERVKAQLADWDFDGTEATLRHQQAARTIRAGRTDPAEPYRRLARR